MNHYGDHDVDVAEDVYLHEIHAAGQVVGWVGITSPSGEVYLDGDLHPLGSFKALGLAKTLHVPYLPVSAVRVLFPAEWLAAECLGDPDRLRVIASRVSWARSQ